MGDGIRDAFIENDANVIGNYDVGTSILGSSKDRTYRKKSKKRRKRSTRTHKRRSVKHRKKSHRKSKGGIKYTKNGQPYKIMPNGRARFLKKR